MLDQRNTQAYSGHLAQNVELLALYMFHFCTSPVTEIENVPIKLWNKYMLDYMDVILRALMQVPHDVEMGMDV